MALVRGPSYGDAVSYFPNFDFFGVPPTASNVRGEFIGTLSSIASDAGLGSVAVSGSARGSMESLFAAYDSATRSVAAAPVQPAPPVQSVASPQIYGQGNDIALPSDVTYLTPAPLLAPASLPINSITSSARAGSEAGTPFYALNTGGPSNSFFNPQSVNPPAVPTEEKKPSLLIPLLIAVAALWAESQ